MLEFEAHVLFPTGYAVAPSGSDQWGFNCGYNGGNFTSDTPGQNFAMFMWRYNGTAGEFVARTRRANGSFISTALTAPAENTVYRLRVVINGQTDVRFYVNETLVAIHAASVPLATWALGEEVCVFTPGTCTANHMVNLYLLAARVTAPYP